MTPEEIRAVEHGRRIIRERREREAAALKVSERDAHARRHAAAVHAAMNSERLEKAT